MLIMKKRQVSQSLYTIVTIQNGASHADKFDGFGVMYINDADIELPQVKWRQVAMIENIVEQINKSAIAKKNALPATGKESRRLELHAVAQACNLNHGAAWYCKEGDIEVKGASPAWEGELICYVYK